MSQTSNARHTFVSFLRFFSSHISGDVKYICLSKITGGSECDQIGNNITVGPRARCYGCEKCSGGFEKEKMIFEVGKQKSNGRKAQVEPTSSLFCDRAIDAGSMFKLRGQAYPQQDLMEVDPSLGAVENFTWLQRRSLLGWPRRPTLTHPWFAKDQARPVSNTLSDFELPSCHEVDADCRATSEKGFRPHSMARRSHSVF